MVTGACAVGGADGFWSSQREPNTIASIRAAAAIEVAAEALPSAPGCSRLLERDSRVLDVLKAVLLLLLKAAAQRVDCTLPGVDAGRAFQSGSCPSVFAIVSDMVSPANADRPVNISNNTQPNAQTSVGLSAARRAPARETCKRPCPAPFPLA